VNAPESVYRAAGVALLGLLAVVAAGAQAQDSKAFRGAIYTCEVNGRRVTSDRPIPECSAKEQRLLYPDGSLRRVVPPTLTADERAELEAREREAQARRVAEQDAMRRDRNLLARFPNEKAHQKARAAALDDVDKSIRLSESRVKLLQAERKPLMDETEFYLGRALPTKLRTAIDANDAALEAQKGLIQNQEAEKVRINALYDVELARLKKLWAGAPPGSLRAASEPSSAAPSAKSSAATTDGAVTAHTP
jgi:hypothetical protein